MRYYILFTLVVLSSYVAAAAIASLGVAATWRFSQAWLNGCAPRARARALFALRACPTLAGTVGAVVAASTFVRYEPASTREQPGLLLWICAGVCLVLWIAAAIRAVRTASRSLFVARLADHCPLWRDPQGTPVSVVDTDYPVAAVAGIIHPRLLLSSRILRDCTSREIDLIVAHEQAHMRRRDNVARVALALFADPLAASRTGESIEVAWTLAVEQAADAAAAGTDGGDCAEFAAVLVRIARMAEGSAPAWMPELSFYQGDHLAERVRRLVAPSASSGDAAQAVQPMMLSGLLVVALWGLSDAHALHEMMEWLVRTLP